MEHVVHQLIQGFFVSGIAGFPVQVKQQKSRHYIIHLALVVLADAAVFIDHCIQPLM